MHQDVRRETRFALLVGTMVVAYGGAVTLVAATHGQERLLLPRGVSDMLGVTIAVAFAFMFAAYALDLMLRRRPARPLRVMAEEFREHVLRPDWLISRATTVLGWYLLILFFTPMKVMIGHIAGFPLDRAFAAADRMLFFGHDPWRITHALLGGTWPTFVLQLAYNMWFVVMSMSLVYAVMRPERVALRVRYVVAFLACWMLVGSLAAYAMASAGPCYYERVLGDPYFAPLMERLQFLDGQIRALHPHFGVWAVSTQDMLWNAFTARKELFGGGISAMPSMHVAVAVLMALAGRELGRVPGLLLWGYAAMIWIGSIHLAWHYALDGIVAAGITLAIWRTSGVLTERFVLAEPKSRVALA